ncbi:MAG: protein kinase [Candidatus Aminicenantes bacterium]|nr:MAG: protein kinase [Candidatus Aminicenantes bacterium]
MATILVLEGISKHADMIRTHLEKQEFKVWLSPSIIEGRKVLEKQLPDFLVIDLNVADKGFFEFYRWILANHKTAGIPRLFISGKMQAELAKQLQTENKETILNKPLDINRFLSTVNKLKSAKNKSPIITKYREQDYFSTLLGKPIGPAIIKKEIGRGGMGAVFLGVQESLDREVAIKLLLPELVGDDAAIERFQREALSIAKLKSPHIVQIFDFGELDNHALYIIMEYLPGQTVDQYLKRNGSFPLEKAISVIIQVATGLQAAHDAGLIHRDIKPSNLIMNNKGHVTITDFGLVRPQKKLKHTQSGILVGTPHYMPPELASDTPLDARSDIYSLGMVFYHLIAGHPPFLSNNPMEILMKHLNEPLPDLRKAIPDFPREVYDIIERMTAKDPKERYINCRELLWDLKSQERKYVTPTSPLSRPGQEEGIATEKVAKIKVDSSLFPGLSRLRNQFPAIFSQDNLLGTMTISASGSLVSRNGEFPEEWKNAIFILHESTTQLDDTVRLGKWKFKLVETADEILAVFPQGKNLGTMMYSNKDTGSFSSASLKNVSASFESGRQSKNPIRQIASIAGVFDVLLFNPDGQLADYVLKDSHRLGDYNRRLPPVSQIIQSISFNISGLDLWYEKGRVLLWRLDSGILFIIASVDISRSFLSIYITANLEKLNTAAIIQTAVVEDANKKKKTPPKKEPQVNNPVPPDLMEKIQLELARMIGPIAKVVLSKECKQLGYSRGNFPDDQMSSLIQKLTKHVEDSKQEQFNHRVQDTIYDYRSKK